MVPNQGPIRDPGLGPLRLRAQRVDGFSVIGTQSEQQASCTVEPRLSPATLLTDVTTDDNVPLPQSHQALTSEGGQSLDAIAVTGRCRSVDTYGKVASTGLSRGTDAVQRTARLYSGTGSLSLYSAVQRCCNAVQLRCTAAQRACRATDRSTRPHFVLRTQRARVHSCVVHARRYDERALSSYLLPGRARRRSYSR